LDLKKKKRKEQKTSEERDDDNDADEQEDSSVQLHIGDKARRADFEELVEAAPLLDGDDDDTNKKKKQKTQKKAQRIHQKLGPMKAAQLVPWVPPYLTDYLIVLADPRRNSNDLGAAIRYLSESPAEKEDDASTTTAIAVSADPPSDVLAWKKRVATDEGDSSSREHIVRLFSDSPSLDWMRTYSCVDIDDGGTGANRSWSLHVLIFDSDGIIRKHLDQVDPSRVCQIVSDLTSITQLDS